MFVSGGDLEKGSVKQHDQGTSHSEVIIVAVAFKSKPGHIDNQARLWTLFVILLRWHPECESML